MMISFVFMLTPDASGVAVERALFQLEEQFPEHLFFAGAAEVPEMENSIVAIHGSAGAGGVPGTIDPPDPRQVAEVKTAFRSILEDLRSWKPS